MKNCECVGTCQGAAYHEVPSPNQSEKCNMTNNNNRNIKQVPRELLEAIVLCVDDYWSETNCRFKTPSETGNSFGCPIDHLETNLAPVMFEYRAKAYVPTQDELALELGRRILELRRKNPHLTIFRTDSGVGDELADLCDKSYRFPEGAKK